MNNTEELLKSLEQFEKEAQKLDDDIKEKLLKDIEKVIRSAFLDQLVRDGQAMGDYSS